MGENLVVNYKFTELSMSSHTVIYKHFSHLFYNSAKFNYTYTEICLWIPQNSLF